MDRKKAIEVRNDFFDHILHLINMPPRAMDALLLQAQYHVGIDQANVINDSELGDLFIPINPSFRGVSWVMGYSLWQIGTVLKVAVMTQAASPDECFLRDIDAKELEDFWPTAQNGVLNRREQFYFYEWSFDVPDFLENYAVRESFALGMRHMHFRVLRLLKKFSDEQRDLIKKG